MVLVGPTTGVNLSRRYDPPCCQAPVSSSLKFIFTIPPANSMAVPDLARLYLTLPRVFPEAVSNFGLSIELRKLWNGTLT